MRHRGDAASSQVSLLGAVLLLLGRRSCRYTKLTVRRRSSTKTLHCRRHLHHIRHSRISPPSSSSSSSRPSYQVTRPPLYSAVPFDNLTLATFKCDQLFDKCFILNVSIRRRPRSLPQGASDSKLDIRRCISISIALID